MVAGISIGEPLYGVLAYNGKKINETKGRLLTTNRVCNDGMETVGIRETMEGFLVCMPEHMRVEKPVFHISPNPHPSDVLTDTELQDTAHEYLEKLGYGSRPYLIVKHEDIDRHHLHIVTISMDERGRRFNQNLLLRCSDHIRGELEREYGLHPAKRRNLWLENPLRKVNISTDNVKRQVGNAVKTLSGQYRSQATGEYHVLLSSYNMTVEEAQGNVCGHEYHGLVYSVTDNTGNKTGNLFESSLSGKSVGREAVQKKFARPKQEIKGRKLVDLTKRAVLSVLEGTYDKEKFVSRLGEKNIDAMLRYMGEGRIYGVTLIDHHTGCVPNGSRMDRELSANTLQGHFTLPYTGLPPITLSVPVETVEDIRGQTASDHENTVGGVGLPTPEGPAVGTKGEAFARAMQHRRKKKRRGGSEM